MEKDGAQSVRLPLMPDFSHSFYGFRHTAHSALKVLDSLGVPAARITLCMAGAGDPASWIIQQSPPPGTPLWEDTQVVLHVSGLGFFHALPVSMWHRSGEEELGTAEILELLDDPFQKALHWICEGAQLFDISPGNPAACARWISLFGLDPEQWPAKCLYPLALIVSSLHKLAGTVPGIGLALDLILHLPLKEMRFRRACRHLEQKDLSVLGAHANRLSVDYVLGDRYEDAAAVELALGPVDLETYYEFSGQEGSALLERTLRLVMPCHGRWLVSWIVADPEKYPLLGIEKENSLLGINSYLGRKKEPVAALS
jgi:hypothetical protein